MSLISKELLEELLELELMNENNVWEYPKYCAGNPELVLYKNPKSQNEFDEFECEELGYVRFFSDVFSNPKIIMDRLRILLNKAQGKSNEELMRCEFVFNS